MTFWSFGSVGEFMLFLTSFAAGMTILMDVNTISATPKFMFSYYKYVKKDENAQADMPEFWSKVPTYYFLITIGTQLFLQPLNFTLFFRRLSLLFRLETGGILMFIELLIVCLVPHTGSTEVGALVGVVLAAFVGGVGRSLFENSVFALFGPCHPKIIGAYLLGPPVSATLMSIIQIILLKTMRPEFHPILKQSVIYFCVALFIIFATLVLLALLNYNPFAKRDIAEFRSDKSFWQNIYTSPKKLQHNSVECEFEHGAEPGSLGLVVPEAKGCEPSTEKKSELVDVSTANMLHGVSLLPVIKKIYPMLINCLITFVTTYLMFPGVLTQVDKPDKWYSTLIVATFNVGNLTGRSLTMLKFLQVPPKGVLITIVPRVFIIPILLLCSKHVIKGKVVPYIFTAIFGLAGGYTEALCMRYCVSLPKLGTAGERSIAGQVAIFVLLFSVSVGSFIQIFALRKE